MATAPESTRPAGPLPAGLFINELGHYDRSKVPGDAMLVIPDQTEEEYHARHWKYPFCEFIDGTVFMHAAASFDHQKHIHTLIVLIELYHIARPVGFITSGPAPLKLREGCYLEPDLFILPGDFDPKVWNLDVHDPALLVVEVLSPSNRSHDLTTKAELYRQADTVEVWTIDGRDRVVLVDRRAADGRESFRVGSGPLRSIGLPGFWIDVDWLWADPRPNLMQYFERIVAGPPPGP